ncbi:V-type proton ATPase 116 kDa subunit a [Drosophila sechellia]|uniref:V-type proton ATPase subunit a n=1 Tax=Drosophila sechellia TaxID=7238 RepID=B4HX76_DROSE|nr:V-type proton ATPase 116 kDa subunit a [Drosophila sechellia]XP_032580799.1 V-type proton ATPase 116 kDa subunit a [Drosophila sechellia]EDW52621.1 GM19181 [Drosophila sechellia]
MGDMFRSEKMALCPLFIQPEAAYASIAELGEKGCVQFRDLNEEVSAFQRKYVNEVRRCDDMERRLRYVESEMKKDEVKLPVLRPEEEPSAPNPREIVDLEAQLEKTDNELREMSANGASLDANFRHMQELKCVLENTEGFFSDQEVINLDVNRKLDPEDPANLPGAAQRGQLAFVAGVIKLERFFSFERMLWRISRGNIFLRRADIDGLVADEETGRPVLKTVFVAFFQGEQLKQRIKKVCTGYHAAVYPCPSSHAERKEMIKDVNVRLEDLKLVLSQSADHRSRVLNSASKHLPRWSIMVRKMKAIYHILNFFNPDVTGKCLIGEGWVPTNDISTVQDALARASKISESSIPAFMNVIETNEMPPTYTRTNKFTNGFQNLVDSYGMASYREVNPALYACITFPFLFAVMFGDLGHGLILLLFASWLIIKEKQLSSIKEEIFNIFLGGRYIIFLMGIFSIYTGFIYNDVFSKSMNIFGSAWHMNYTRDVVQDENLKYITLRPNDTVYKTYPFGMDPIWQLAENKIIFLNTFKMKLSIIVGVIHMIFGVSMSVVNFAYYKKYASIFLEFLPQVLFLLLLFGYMVFMMFFKWVVYNDTVEGPLSPACAPSILILFINMILQGSQDTPEPCKEFMFEGQKSIQQVFVIIAIICIPWMLLGKPLYIMIKRKTSGAPPPKPQSGGGEGHGEDDEMGEIFIHQAIHTIEYVLSTVSHTASYLRLWALSLAHAQLSEVLWNMVFSMGFKYDSYIGGILIYVFFGAWALLTVGILVLIEGLSAFLHTLRLHWVEFMSKFYEGAGYAFEPFAFKTILDVSEDD